MSADIPLSAPYNIHSSQKPLTEIKEPTISKIELSQSDLDKLKKVLQSPKMGPLAKQIRQRKIIGICGCGGIPEFILTRYYEGLQRIERYCATCLNKSRITVILRPIKREK